MKKLSLMFIAMAMTAATYALPSYVSFYSEGPDLYNDGTQVLDGESYLLVWVAEGTDLSNAPFLAADGTVADAYKGKVEIVAAAPIAKDGKCPLVYYMLTGENEKLVNAKGTFSVYLLDTRVTTTDAEGKTVTTLAALNAAGKPTVVNKVTGVAASLATQDTAVAAQGTVTAEGAVASAVPADVTKPVVSAIKVVGGKVFVTVGNTSPFLQYTVSGGKTPSNLDQKNLAVGVNGSADGITLIVDDPKENRFFQVIRK